MVTRKEKIKQHSKQSIEKQLYAGEKAKKKRERK